MIVFDNIIALLQRTGGISVMFNEIYLRLHRDGVDFSVFGFSLQRLDAASRNSPPRLLERYRDFSGVLPQKKNSAVFHSTYYRLPIDPSYKVVTTVHDFTYERAVGGVPRWVHSIQKNRAIRGSDKVICVSENTKSDLLFYLPDTPPEKICVIYNGVSEGFYPDPLIAKKEVVLFVGQRSRYKNFRSVVLALSKSSSLTLECVGGGGFTKLELELLERYVPNRYCHLGYVTELDLNLAYNRALCLVYPSLYEGFGIPVLEAMRAGCPVIAVNTSSIPEVAGDAGLLLEKADPCGIYDAIEKVQSMDVRNNLIRKGIVQSSKFSWESTYSETLSVYKEMLIGG